MIANNDFIFNNSGINQSDGCAVYVRKEPNVYCNVIKCGMSKFVRVICNKNMRKIGIIACYRSSLFSAENVPVIYLILIIISNNILNYLYLHININK